MELVVAPTPDKKLAWNNCVYINPANTKLLANGAGKTNYVSVNDAIVWIAQTSDGLPATEIGMNAAQRSSAKVGNGVAVQVSVFKPPQGSGFHAISMRLELDLIDKRRLQVREEELSDFLRKHFKNHILTRDQAFYVDFQGAPISLTVRTIECPVESTGGADEKKLNSEITKFADRAMLVPETMVEVDTKNKTVVVEKSASARRSPLLNPSWKFADMGIGGLDEEFSAIFRRSFASRLFPPAVIEKLGIKHVKGMLLYGPPGTGKTLIARQIGKMLAGKEPQVVNGPEILNKFVGQSEENIRALFAPAEKEYAEKKEASDLHIIIFDEIDAICKQRGTNRGGTGVHDTVVNQLLSKIDGVNSPNNILVIGMTNRKDMIDSALLRPGRLEVHVEIGLPDTEGRVQILNIHTATMRKNGFLHKDVDVVRLAELTKNFSGAEIEGLVKSATSYALYGSIDVTAKDGVVPKPGDLKNIQITMDDFLRALSEVKPAFGVSEDELKTILRQGELIDYGDEYKQIMKTGNTLVRQVQHSQQTPLLSLLLEGPEGSGKTCIAAKLAMDSGFPYVKLITPENFVGEDERQKCMDISKIFEDAYKSPFSLIIIDNIERLLEYVPIGPRLSNQVLQTLLVCVKKLPPHEGRKLMVVGTTSNPAILEDMQLRQAFNVQIEVKQLTKPDQIKKVFKGWNVEVDSRELELIATNCAFPIGIKQLLLVIEMARQGGDGKHMAVTAAKFQECLDAAGLSKKRRPRAEDYDKY